MNHPPHDEPRAAENGKLVHCPGCGACVPDVSGPMGPYAGASPGCWAVYGEVLEKEYGEYRYPPVHLLTVDTYAVQHLANPGSQSLQSVAVHLIGLFLVFEQGLAPGEVPGALRRVLAAGPKFHWLEPPTSRSRLTVLDVRGAGGLADHTQRVERWAKSVWDAWAPHHTTIRGWLGR